MLKLEQANSKLSVIGALDRFNLGDKSFFVFAPVEGDIELDLAKSDTIDTAGLAWILKMVSIYQQNKKQVSISNAPSQLIALAELSNVLALLPIKKAV